MFSWPELGGGGADACVVLVCARFCMLEMCDNKEWSEFRVLEDVLVCVFLKEKKNHCLLGSSLSRIHRSKKQFNLEHFFFSFFFFKPISLLISSIKPHFVVGVQTPLCWQLRVVVSEGGKRGCGGKG